MNISDALNLLSLSSPSTQAEIKKGYKIASVKFHPDKNPAGAEMMVTINEAYSFLKELGDTVTANEDFKESNYAEELQNILNSLMALDGLVLELCSSWLWISGDTKKHAKALGKNGLGLFYASKKQMWYYRPADYKSKSRKSTPMVDIRNTYGSNTQFHSTRRTLSA